MRLNRAASRFPGISRVVAAGPVGPSATCRTALRNALGALGVKLGAALDAPPWGQVFARSPSVRLYGWSRSALPTGIHSSLDFRPCQEWNERGPVWSQGPRGASCPGPLRWVCGRVTPGRLSSPRPPEPVPPQMLVSASGRGPCARKHGDGSKCRNWPGRFSRVVTADLPAARQPAPAPWEGPS